MSTSERSTPVTSLAATDRRLSQAGKPQRVMACVLCQQRKVKCDRQFPCGNCVRSHARCVPAATQVPRQRRRRFPERELLDRLRRYESLLHHSNIKFEPLHKDHPTTEKQMLSTDNEGHGYDSKGDGQPAAAASASQPSSPAMAVKSETVYEAKYALVSPESYLA